MGQHERKIRSRAVEFDPQGPGPKNRNADLGKIIQGAHVVGLGVLDPVKHAHVRGSEFRIQNPAVGVGKIGGGHRIAVAPTGIPQVESPDPLPGIAFPALGHSWQNLRAGLRMFGHQPLKERLDNPVFRNSRHYMRIEVAGLRSVVQEEDSLAGRCRRGVLPPPAPGKEEAAQKQEIKDLSKNISRHNAAIDWTG